MEEQCSSAALQKESVYRICSKGQQDRQTYMLNGEYLYCAGKKEKQYVNWDRSEAIVEKAE